MEAELVEGELLTHNLKRILVVAALVGGAMTAATPAANARCIMLREKPTITTVSGGASVGLPYR
jgi:hypothetical protein